MSYSAPNRLLMPSRHSIDTTTDSWFAAETSASTGAAWPSANLAIYVPLRIPSRVVVRKLWYANSSTSSAGSVDMGLYDAGGVSIVAATEAAKQVANGEATFDVTDTTVGPGLYYIALASNSGADTFLRWAPAAPMALWHGVLTEASAYPLPATATFAANQTLAYVPVIGVLVEATVA